MRLDETLNWNQEVDGGETGGEYVLNYYRVAEKYLYNYRPLKASIENMKKEIEDLDYYVVSSKSLENKGGPVYNNSIIENAVINIDEKRNDLEMEIRRLENKLRRIDKSLEILGETEKYIIEERYFEEKEWWKIAHKLRYSERWCKELRRRAVKKIAISLFGEKAMEDEIIKREMNG